MRTRDTASSPHASHARRTYIFRSRLGVGDIIGISPTPSLDSDLSQSVRPCPSESMGHSDSLSDSLGSFSHFSARHVGCRLSSHLSLALGLAGRASSGTVPPRCRAALAHANPPESRPHGKPIRSAKSATRQSARRAAGGAGRRGGGASRCVCAPFARRRRTLTLSLSLETRVCHINRAVCSYCVCAKRPLTPPRARHRESTRRTKGEARGACATRRRRPRVPEPPG